MIKAYDALPDGSHRRTIEQGYEMERPSQITLTMEIRQGKLGTVRIGGNAVRVSEGRMTIRKS